ncbi:uncharacterized protein TRAVEDRAFT_51977 [Trametes versicolor FP-101664 SS1]|uniref:uncharacterized protein n=1 Tax=Trametes versicolor (strain FP-101664) TaxID=717944 RepID=UPI0004621344|nr:uncharacterized protein TRAVEDRAFT_51977 [Trametes versicolor FP-101664 SS1]EIW54264.1 hypothetical protein TRAVEDRAFT_51977 [Trametes versicolor FP-101664 SS1]
MLPTDTIDSITPDRIAGWINILHGPLTSQCEATEVQFNMLLDIVLVYRAFALGHVAVNPEDFVMFADRLIRAASELHPFDRADEELADIAAWLRINFPKATEALAHSGHTLASNLAQLSLEAAILDYPSNLLPGFARAAQDVPSSDAPASVAPASIPVPVSVPASVPASVPVSASVSLPATTVLPVTPLPKTAVFTLPSSPSPSAAPVTPLPSKPLSTVRSHKMLASPAIQRMQQLLTASPRMPSSTVTSPHTSSNTTPPHTSSAAFHALGADFGIDDVLPVLMECTRRARHRHHAPAHHRPSAVDGAQSDSDSAPSLMTVDCSSCSEYDTQDGSDLEVGGSSDVE